MLTDGQPTDHHSSLAAVKYYARMCVVHLVGMFGFGLVPNAVIRVGVGRWVGLDNPEAVTDHSLSTIVHSVPSSEWRLFSHRAVELFMFLSWFDKERGIAPTCPHLNVYSLSLVTYSRAESLRLLLTRIIPRPVTAEDDWSCEAFCQLIEEQTLGKGMSGFAVKECNTLMPPLAKHKQNTTVTSRPHG